MSHLIGRLSMSLESVSPAHLIRLGSEAELLEVIVSHSEYEVQERMSATYNWEAIESEIRTKYLSNKPRLQFSHGSLSFYSFSEDLNLYYQMGQLEGKQVSRIKPMSN